MADVRVFVLSLARRLVSKVKINILAAVVCFYLEFDILDRRPHIAISVQRHISNSPAPHTQLTNVRRF